MTFGSVWEAEVQNMPYAARQAFKKPDMGNRAGQLNMAQPLSADFGQDQGSVTICTVAWMTKAIDCSADWPTSAPITRVTSPMPKMM